MRSKKLKIYQFSILIILGLLFSLPGLIAYYVYNHPAVLHNQTINKGHLQTPPLDLINKNSSNTTNRHWRLVLWQPLVCDEKCLRNYDLLSRVHLALGRRLYNVDIELWSGTNKIANKAILTKNFPKNTVLLISPASKVILTYDGDVIDSKAIFDDLSHLLKIGEMN